MISLIARLEASLKLARSVCASGTYVCEGWSVGESSLHKHVFHHYCYISGMASKQGYSACYATAGQSLHRDRRSLAVFDFGRRCRSKLRVFNVVLRFEVGDRGVAILQRPGQAGHLHHKLVEHLELM